MYLTACDGPNEQSPPPPLTAARGRLFARLLEAINTREIIIGIRAIQQRASLVTFNVRYVYPPRVARACIQTM